MQKNETFEELVKRYDSALAEYGLSYASRLNMICRASAIIRRHEDQGKEQLDDAVIVDYFNEIGNRHYMGEVGKSHWQQMRREIDRFLHFIQSGEIKLANPQKGSRVELLPSFESIAEEFLRSEDFHPNTCNDMRWATHKYFSWLTEQGHKDLKGVGATQIQSFLIHCSGNVAMGSLHNIKLFLKKLYAYLYTSGQSESSYGALLSFKVNRGTKIPPVLEQEEVKALLDNIDSNTAAGKRAYAVILLGAVLGLRACDVVNLKLDDIDWINGEIKILQVKTAETVVLPLTKTVGEALQDYILNARPKTTSNNVFIRLLAPYNALKSAVTVGEIYRDCCIAAGLPVNKKFHTLRRTLGTSMVTSGIPVTMVAQVLGHTEIDSTKKYIAFDRKHLIICALPFDGIFPFGGVTV